MKTRLFCIVAACLAMQLISVAAPAQTTDKTKHVPTGHMTKGTAKAGSWMDHGSKNINHWLNGTSKKINHGTNQASKKTNHVFQGKK